MKLLAHSWQHPFKEPHFGHRRNHLIELRSAGCQGGFLHSWQRPPKVSDSGHQQHPLIQLPFSRLLRLLTLWPLSYSVARPSWEDQVTAMWCQEPSVAAIPAVWSLMRPSSSMMEMPLQTRSNSEVTSSRK